MTFVYCIISFLNGQIIQGCVKKTQHKNAAMCVILNHTYLTAVIKVDFVNTLDRTQYCGTILLPSQNLIFKSKAAAWRLRRFNLFHNERLHSLIW